MIKEKISSQEVIDLVASKASVSKRAVEEFLKVMISTIESALIAGESVKIKNYGTFKLQWNEPRKSVNVQTGEEILLSGYYKVTFTPDAILKDLVNEPFAHLEPVILDQQQNEPVEEDDDDDDEIGLDPLRVFNDQASEIKDLISEIQSLSSKPKPVFVEKKEELKPQKQEFEEPAKIFWAEKVVELPKESLHAETLQRISTELHESKELLKELVEIQPNSQKKHDYTSFQTREPEPKQAQEYISNMPSTPYLDYAKPAKKRRIWLYFLIIFFFLAGIGSGLYMFVPQVKDGADSVVNNLRIVAGNISEDISTWFAPAPEKVVLPVKKTVVKPKPIVVLKDTSANDTIDKFAKIPVDSLQLMFDNPRIYTRFITSEKTVVGSRLTRFSKKYYDDKAFWVYIYEANKEKISDPDNIAIGILIRIPRLDPRLIDLANPRCIKKARELHSVYIK